MTPEEPAPPAVPGMSTGAAVPGRVPATPARTSAVVSDVAPAGEYVRVVLAGHGLGAALPGQFAALSVGGPDSCLVAARVFGIADADPVADTLTLVIATVGAGSRWLAGRRPGERVPVVTPLGRPFDLVGSPAWVGVGGGYGAAALPWAARLAQAAGIRVSVVVGAGTAARLCEVPRLRAVLGEDLVVTTEDGSAGLTGTVLTPLPGVVDRLGGAGARPSVTVGACGPMPMLAAVAAAVRADHRVRCEVAVEERMACGIGVCMTCVLPVVGDDGLTRMTRACTAGAVLPAERVRWEAITGLGSDVPADAVGAPGAAR